MDSTSYHFPPTADAPPYDGNTPPVSKQQQQQNNSAVHQRTYQACIPCRRRKVRCDLGSVDNPSDPPCVRCRRESKECFFSATRRKKKNPGDENSGDDEDVPYEVKSGRKRMRTDSVPEPVDEHNYDEPRTPGGSIGRSQPLRRPTGPRQVQYGEADHKASEQTIGLLQATEVHSGHDALKLLYEASQVHSARRPENGTGQGSNNVSPQSVHSDTSPIMENAGKVSYNTGPMAMYQSDPMWKAPTGPKSVPPEPVNPDNEAYTSAVRAWTRFRFVRAGWFTAREAIAYIDYFHQYLSPLTPVSLSGFKPYEKHVEMLMQEPMLTVTMLLVSSRHMALEGPGSQSRPYAIHQKLWHYLSGMIARVVWGQEQFGGGFCGAGSEPQCDVNPLTRKGLRTLGTVESLVLLTEWHPRAMHFPPDEADDELMVPEEAGRPTDGPEPNGTGRGIGGTQRIDTWLEPCWRSDRMCWMLLNMAMSLSFEIGVFDSGEWQRHARSPDGHPLSAEELQAYDRRRGNVRDILLIYITQTSGRLGLTSMLPNNYTRPEDSPLHNRPIGQHESVQETVLHFWLRMAALLREGNQKIFANKAYTRDLIRNGDYRAALDRLQPPLREWRQDFDKTACIPKFMRCILEIEYEYCRVYVNALSLQAVAERCANANPLGNIDPPLEVARSAIETANGSRPDIAIAPQTLAQWLGGDRYYMLEVGDAARNLLKVVVDDLCPGEYLKHAPVRTYFRIISVSIVLLKSFSLGASESDVSDSLTLMDRTVEALRHCIVDDVHVASRFADLLDTLTQNLKPRLVRIATDGRVGGRSRGESHDGDTNPMVAPLGSVPQRMHAHQQGVNGNNPLAHQQPWAYNNGIHAPAVSQAPTPNNALYGVSNDTYDLMGPDNNYSIMPPPSFGLHSPASTRTNPNGNAAAHNPNGLSTTPGGSAYDPYAHANFENSSMQDWLALPLDPLINMSGADVNQTMYGPELGGQDMLELLLSGSGHHPNGNGFP